MSHEMKIGIVGVGKVGTAIGILLAEAGYTIHFISSTNAEKLSHAVEEMKKASGGKESISSTDPLPHAKEVDILFITTPDRVIGDVAKDTVERGGIREGQLVVHMSGSLTSDVLSPVRGVGAYAASLHPLQSFADYIQAQKNIPGSIFCLEGDPETKSALKEIITVLKGKEVEVPKEEKPLYHAGAVVASNYLVSLIWAALMMYEIIGLDNESAITALMPLIEGTLKNIRALGAPRALTGPIARGDVETIKDHLEAIGKKAPHLMDFYRVMGDLTVSAAEKNQSAPKELLDKIRSLLVSP
jgi:predicted short-subunit dehydrogenase-like oxidoreductase (DUF2520 family)